MGLVGGFVLFFFVGLSLVFMCRNVGVDNF